MSRDEVVREIERRHGWVRARVLAEVCGIMVRSVYASLYSAERAGDVIVREVREVGVDGRLRTIKEYKVLEEKP